MRIIDITMPLDTRTPVYPGDPTFAVDRLSEAEGGDTYALSRLTMSSHAGTHVDPPAHFEPGGATAESVPLDACIGPAVVLNVVASAGEVTSDALVSLPAGTERVLLRTGGPPLDGPSLSEAAARALVQSGVRLTGIDALSVGSPAVHHILLQAGVVILEGLDLSSAPSGPTTLLCLPLKLTGSDGAPARAVLLYE
jgi:arylformamidase